MTTHSSITKQLVDEAEEIVKVSEIGEEIEAEEKKLKRAKLQVRVTSFTQAEEVQRSNAGAFGLEEEEAPMPMPISPEPTTPLHGKPPACLSQVTTPEEVKEAPVPKGKTDQIQSIIDQLRTQMFDNKTSVFAPPRHMKQKSSVNPYLSNASGTSSHKT